MKEDDAEIQFFFQYTEDFKCWTLMITSEEAISPEEYLLCMKDFIKEYPLERLEKLVAERNDFSVENTH